MGDVQEVSRGGRGGGREGGRGGIGLTLYELRIALTGGLRLLDGGSGLQFAVGLLVCIGGLRTVAVKKPYLTHGTNRFAEIVGWQLVLTFVGAQVVSISDGDKTDSAVDAFLVAVQVGGGLLAVVGAGFEAMGFRQENAEALAAVVPVGGGVGGGDLGGGEGEQENLQ